MSTHQLVEVFLGDAITYTSEREFLARLRFDLERRGIRARIHANFLTRRGQRQVDFLIVTEHRLVNAELKTVDQALPLIASLNGPWGQKLPNGATRAHDRNYYRQAHDATYAINDDMHQLASAGHVPGPASRKFYNEIQTVVCVAPDLPAGTEIERHKHVAVVGYPALLGLLTTDGPRPEWTDEHWDTFARSLRLVPERVDGAEEAKRRASLATLEDYRLRFASTLRRDLHEYVPIPATSGGALVDNPLAEITAAAAGQRSVALVGPSGAGKSHVAQHAAAALADAGAVPVWLDCKDYVHGQFSRALSRAVAPYTVEAALPLLRRAVDAGTQPVVFLDGVNEVSPDDRAELLRQLTALCLRVPAAAVITTTVPVEVPFGDTLLLTAGLPDPETRTALLASYGRATLAGVEAFTLPLELALAAECADTLPPNASATELFDTYVTARCPAETTRAALRHVAAAMDEQLRGSLTVPEVRALLHRAGLSSAPDADVDAVLNSPLLNPTQGRVSFTHELLARFLAAEQLVLSTGTAVELAERLRDPRQHDLRRHGVVLEHDSERRRDLLLELADAGLLHDAAIGKFGVATAAQVRAEIVATLADATAMTGDAEFVRASGDPENAYDGAWWTRQPRTAARQALLVAAGESLIDGLFVVEVGRLFDATDRRSLDEVRAMKAAGHRVAITSIVRAAYSGLIYSGDSQLHALAATAVINACGSSRIRRGRTRLSPSPSAALWQGVASQHSWGRLTAALHLIDADDPADAALLPDLVAAAWAANGYHMRLLALTTASEKARRETVDDDTRRRMCDVLESFDKNNPVLNGVLLEALAAYGALDEPLNSEESIRDLIGRVLAEPENPEAQAAAHSIIAMVFEDSTLHGPFDEVIASLNAPDTLRLHVMAARSAPFPFHHDWLMSEIFEHIQIADDAARTVVEHAVRGMDWGSPMRCETVTAHLLALRAWVQLEDALPAAPPTGGNVGRRAWRILDELMFALLRENAPTAPELLTLWSELLDLCAPAAVDAFLNVRLSQTWEHEYTHRQQPLYQLLLEAWPDQVRQLLEWGVANPDRVVATFDNGPSWDGRRQLVSDLALVGDDGTVALLQAYLNDPEVGAEAVATVRALQHRG